MRCHCDSMMPYELCCEPLISGEKEAKTALALMRSRFSAHVEQQAVYIFNTYGEHLRSELLIENIEQSLKGIQWNELEILSVAQGRAFEEEGVVEFLAHYTQNSERYTMHERSLFQKENGVWRYIGTAQ